MRAIIFVVSWTCLAVAALPAVLLAQDLYCTGEEISRNRLTVDGGRELFIESSVLAVSGSRTLLAGKPSYLFLKRNPDEPAELGSRNTVFGVVLEADGSARLVPAPPVPGRILAAVAGIGTTANSWRVIFAEVDSVGVNDPKVTAFWHGIYDGQQWYSLERLSQPSGKALQYLNTSPLAEAPDTVVWAALTALEEHRQSVVVFERRNGAWSHEIVATPFASGVEAFHSPALGFVLAITHDDQGGDRAAFLYTRRSGWTSHRKLRMVGTDGRAVVLPRPPNVSFDRDSMRLAFSTPMPLALGNREEPLLTVARELGQSFSVVALGDSTILWATDYADSTGVSELRLDRPVADSTVSVWRSPNPFRGPFTAARRSPSEVLIVGPELDETHGVLASLILRIRVDCDRNRKKGAN